MMMPKGEDFGFNAQPRPLRGDESAEEIAAKLDEIRRPKPNGAAAGTDGVEILASVEEFIRRFLILPDAAYLPLALWSMATYLANVFDAFPYLAITSPTKRCGKTRVLEILELLCARALNITSTSVAALFRLLTTCPTLLIDEIEIFKTRNRSEATQAIISILNVGYKKGITVPRCEPPKNKVKHFPVYSPKAFCAIGTLPDTISDRSICISMHRRTKNQKRERFSQRSTPNEAKTISSSLKRWAQSEQENICRTYDQTDDLEWLEDRDAEIWLPLFVVCAVAAPDHLGRLKADTLALTKTKAADDVDDSLSLKLLSDVRDIWPAKFTNMHTASLLGALKCIPDSPWAEKDHELTAHRFGRMIRPFGPCSQTVRDPSGKDAKGYRRADFEEPFSRYLPSIAVETVTSVTTPINTDESANFERVTKASCDGSENDLKPA